MSLTDKHKCSVAPEVHAGRYPTSFRILSATWKHDKGDRWRYLPDGCLGMILPLQATQSFIKEWRKGRDSNPRYRLRSTPD